jgi:hypothetical protein
MEATAAAGLTLDIDPRVCVGAPFQIRRAFGMMDRDGDGALTFRDYCIGNAVFMGLVRVALRDCVVA